MAEALSGSRGSETGSSFWRLVRLALAGSCLVPLVTVICARLSGGEPWSGSYLIRVAALALGVLAAVGLLLFLLRRYVHRLDTEAREQARFLDGIAPRWLDLAIFGSAALSLLLELAVIRWQSAVFEFFAFYKNFSLLACFAGLGLGYALGKRDHLPLVTSIPMLVWLFALLIGLRFGMPEQHVAFLNAMPLLEQAAMGSQRVKTLSQAFAVYYFLSVIFILTALVFVPVGQLCGRLLERREKLRAYGLNLLGSILGVLASFALGALWTPPMVWFALCFVGLLPFYARRWPSLLLGFGASLAGLVVLAWPVSPLWGRVYTPYQLLEIGRQPEGLLLIRAAGTYYQRVHDLSVSNRNVEAVPRLRSTRGYYDLPYRVFGAPAEVAIVGAGTGNDVAAALRNGAVSVDAIEIDPVILMAGRDGHPERPYQDPRVRAIVNDARSFLRNTDRTYDMIVYGLLDSHTLLSHASSVRLDSFVYTVEGLREARARLKPGGALALSFSVFNDEVGRKIYLMLEEAFDGRPPLVVNAGYDSAVVYLASSGRSPTAPADLSAFGFSDVTSYYGDAVLKAEPSRDDWPFFYMPRRVYPMSYVLMACQIGLMSLLLIGSLTGARPQFGHLSFFFLGAGFMLIETKGITELGLTFGNSWQVIGIVIVSILVMAFLGNVFVQRFKLERPFVPYLLLLASLGVGFAVSAAGGLPSTTWGRIGTAILATCPILFSGIVFSTSLAARGEISSIMAMNLMGAILGGLLEYNSLYFGFRFLYLIAAGVYLAALLSQTLALRVPSRSLAAPDVSG
jgi:spermidine synthase